MLESKVTKMYCDVYAISWSPLLRCIRGSKIFFLTQLAYVEFAGCKKLQNKIRRLTTYQWDFLEVAIGWVEE